MLHTAALASFSIGELRKRMAVMIAPALSPKTVTCLIIRRKFTDVRGWVYFALVTTKTPNIGLNPFECSQLIFHGKIECPLIIGCAFALHVG